MAASSKDGLYIGETYVTVIHSVTLASAASSDNHKSRGVLNTSHQVLGVLSTHVTSPMVDNTDEWSRTPILMLHQPYLKTIVTEGAHLRNSISSDNVQQIKLIFAI